MTPLIPANAGIQIKDRFRFQTCSSGGFTWTPAFAGVSGARFADSP